MSFDTLGQLNWLAVVVATLAYFLLGAIWYLPATPTGRAWMRSSGFQRDATSPAPSPVFYLVPLVFYLAMTIAAAWLARATESDTLSEGVILGLLLSLGFTLPIIAIAVIFEPEPKPAPWVFVAVQSAYNVLGLLIVGIIVSVWR